MVVDSDRESSRSPLGKTVALTNAPLVHLFLADKVFLEDHSIDDC